MRKLVLGAALLLASATAMATGYVSTDYQAYDYANTDSNFQRMETFVGVSVAENGFLELRHRDTYNGANNFRARYTHNITDDFSIRGQYYTSAGEKASYRIQPRYKTILNKIDGVSHTVVLDFNKSEHGEFYTGAQSWLYITIPQNIIPSLTFNNETYFDDFTTLKEEDVTIAIDTWFQARVFEYEAHGYRLYIEGRLYSWSSLGLENSKLSHDIGARAHVGVVKQFEINGAKFNTRVEYQYDSSLEDSKDTWQYVAARLTYKF